ncbi:MAG: class I SAM-dependent methyltransferase [Chlamydiia bacterium]|nr:class I SAM-dependent methyltransferase [Chlamydiia bacterium]
MRKEAIIQSLIDRNLAKSYLEIGVFRGETFLQIRSKRKVAVDPFFRIPLSDKLRWTLRNPNNLFAHYHEVTSDAYFADHCRHTFDVIFIDGLHTYQQSLKDLLNSLSVLNDNGVILMHDCLPPHAAAATPAHSAEAAEAANIPGWTGEWCGDVWKTICYLRSHCPDLRVSTLPHDYGIGVITKGTPQDTLSLSEQEIEQMTFNDLLANRDQLLNIQDFIELNSII